MDETINDIIATLHAEGCSCVIFSRGTVTLCRERGVKDLLRLLEEDPSILRGAMIADKVVGKGAAALMILGGVKAIYADVISRPALELFSTVDVSVDYRECVPNIINRAGTGICPVEKLCMDSKSAEECFPLIKKFVGQAHN